MIYVFDSSPLIDLFKYYYANRFPSLWEKFDELINVGKIITVSEVFAEIDGWSDRLSSWAKKHKDIFLKPTTDEMNFVTEIFRKEHFQTMVRKQARLQGQPVADPFVIAKAKIVNGNVVTQEKFKPNAAQIPNVCKHFKIPCYNLEEFMEIENWKF